MEGRTYLLDGVRVLEFPVEGPSLEDVRVAVELIGEAAEQSAGLVVLPVERMGEAFFQLRTGVAGEILQKFVTYRMRVAILGDLTHFLSQSKPLHDFIVECNRGSAIWFVRDVGELEQRLHQELQAREQRLHRC